MTAPIHLTDIEKFKILKELKVKFIRDDRVFKTVSIDHLSFSISELFEIGDYIAGLYSYREKGADAFFRADKYLYDQKITNTLYVVVKFKNIIEQKNTPLVKVSIMGEELTTIFFRDKNMRQLSLHLKALDRPLLFNIVDGRIYLPYLGTSVEPISVIDKNTDGITNSCSIISTDCLHFYFHIINTLDGTDEVIITYKDNAFRISAFDLRKIIKKDDADISLSKKARLLLSDLEEYVIPPF